MGGWILHGTAVHAATHDCLLPGFGRCYAIELACPAQSDPGSGYRWLQRAVRFLLDKLPRRRSGRAEILRSPFRLPDVLRSDGVADAAFVCLLGRQTGAAGPRV